MSLAEFKVLVREQFFMLLLDQEACLAAIPEMLPKDKNNAGTSSAPPGVLWPAARFPAKPPNARPRRTAVWLAQDAGGGGQAPFNRRPRHRDAVVNEGIRR